MDTASKLQRIDQVPSSAIAIEQPLVLLLENGPAFSAILAAHISPEPDDGSVVLEDCTQVRIEQNGDCVRRSFDRVVILRESKRNHWIASPDELESIFSQPSADPYVFVQLPKSKARELRMAIHDRDFEKVFEELRDRFATLPRFYSPTPTELRAPENYATGRNRFSEIKRFL